MVETGRNRWQGIRSGKTASAAGLLLFLALAGIIWNWDSRRQGSPIPVPDPLGEQGSSELDPIEVPRETLEQRREHLARLGVPAWFDRGYRGQGVKVAVLDSGFRDWRNFLGKGLPQRVQARSFRKDGNLEARDSRHGILCAEIVHALAPEAELLLANWEPDSPDSFLEAVAWARREGARILTCSLIMPSWSDGEGGGAVHERLRRLLGNGDDATDLLLCACAGNTALRHWSGTYDPDPSGRHRWAPGCSVNHIVPWGADRLAVELYGREPGTGRLEVRRRGDGRLLGSEPLSRATATAGWTRASVRFDPDPQAEYEVRLVDLPPRAALAQTPFHLVVLGGSLETAVAARSISFPADGERCLAVGAVDDRGRRRTYSACGPNSGRPKPDFVAPVPFPSLLRERPFSGTSAAAPQAAGLAALLWSRRPDLTANGVHDWLRSAAVDLAETGHDHETGFGRLRLPE